VEYQRIGAWRQVPAASTDFFFGGGSGTRPECFRWVVFGTLLGPEATGPGFSRCWFVSGFLAAPVTHLCVGGWYGVVV
jgi:hypothetical protein